MVESLPPSEVLLIKELVEACAGISRTELAHTVCELLDWKRAGGGLKARECRDLLERLGGTDPEGSLQFPVGAYHRGFSGDILGA